MCRYKHPELYNEDVHEYIGGQVHAPSDWHFSSKLAYECKSPTVLHPWC